MTTEANQLILQLQDKLLALCLTTTERLDTSQGTTFTQGQSRYVLDPDGKFGLRVKCGYCDGKGFHEPQNGPKHPCIDCRERGWTPTTDLMLYVRAAWFILPEAADVLEATSYALSCETDPIQAAFDVVWEAVAEAIRRKTNA